MKNFCLVFVFAFVSVFSISAQPNYKSSGNIGAIEKAKAVSDIPKTKIESIKTIGAAYKTNFSKERRTLISAPINLFDASVLSIEKKSLEGFTTGNPTIDGYIEEFSALYSVDPLLIYAQMSQESSFDAGATSPKGAGGYMQLMPDTARRFGVTNIYSPKQNIKAGIKYMRWLMDKFGDVRLALAGYNAGEGAVKKYGNKIPPYRETQNYVAKIMNHYEKIANRDLMTGETVAGTF